MTMEPTHHVTTAGDLKNASGPTVAEPKPASSADQAKSTSNADEFKDVELGATNDAPPKHLDDEEECNTNETPATFQQKAAKSVYEFYFSNQFVIHIVLVIILARLYPPLGGTYLAPKYTAKIAVAIIFVIAGAGLRTTELAKAMGQWRLNTLVNLLNFFAVSGCVFGVTRALVAIGILNIILADGMVICSCLPICINVAIVLTASAGADEACAIFNTVVMNLVGIFLTPILIVLYLGKSGDVSLIEVVLELVYQIVLPLVIGQGFQLGSNQVREFCKKQKYMLKKTQEFCLVFIVYTVFCKTFSEHTNSGVGIGGIILMILYQLIVLLALMVVFWYLMRVTFPRNPEGVVMALFCSTQKTISLGVPLITSMYAGNPNVALYTLPILVYHPMQAIIGSMAVPYLAKFIQSERARLDISETEHDDGKKVDESSDTESVKVEQNKSLALASPNTSTLSDHDGAEE